MTRVVVFLEGEEGPRGLGLRPEPFRRVGIDLRVASCRAEDDRIAACRDADVVLTSDAPITGRLLAACPRLVGVVRFGVGVDTVDLAAATRHGVCVANIPGACTEEVSTATLSLILAVWRRVVQADRMVRVGQWDVRALMPIRRLAGCFLGLVGFGNIARAVARKALAFDLAVWAHDPHVTAEAMASFGVRKAGLTEMLRAADIVSLHAPLSGDTYHLMDADRLRLMKPGAILVNTSRGQIVDEAALVTALREGWIAGAGLDALEQEPPDPGNPLLAMPNVVLTPHCAFFSSESYDDLTGQWAEQAIRMARGEFPTHLVNTEVRRAPNLRLRMAR